MNNFFDTVSGIINGLIDLATTISGFDLFCIDRLSFRCTILVRDVPERWFNFMGFLSV